MKFDPKVTASYRKPGITSGGHDWGGRGVTHIFGALGRRGVPSRGPLQRGQGGSRLPPPWQSRKE